MMMMGMAASFAVAAQTASGGKPAIEWISRL
jgi:hypothetical protein